MEANSVLVTAKLDALTVVQATNRYFTRKSKREAIEMLPKWRREADLATDPPGPQADDAAEQTRTTTLSWE